MSAIEGGWSEPEGVGFRCGTSVLYLYAADNVTFAFGTAPNSPTELKARRFENAGVSELQPETYFGNFP